METIETKTIMSNKPQDPSKENLNTTPNSEYDQNYNSPEICHIIFGTLNPNNPEENEMRQDLLNNCNNIYSTKTPTEYSINKATALYSIITRYINTKSDYNLPIEIPVSMIKEFSEIVLDDRLNSEDI